MPVTTQHPEYMAALPTWQRNRDAVAGQGAIRAARDLYLPIPNAQDISKANQMRYEAYLSRALWYAAPERTKNSLIGSVFRKGPEKQEIPTQVQYLMEDADGAGVSLTQMAKEIIGGLIEVGRIGLLVDYPPTDPGVTAEQTRDRRATIATYPAESVINWRFEQISGRHRLTLVVLREDRPVSEDDYSHETDLQYRVLRLREGVYTQQLLDEEGDALAPEATPRKADGSSWSEIPFVVIGSSNNRPTVDRAPLSHLCNHAIAYWQTSADHRENLHIHGQLTLGVTSDMDHDQFQTANPNGIVVGAPFGVFLGANGGFHTATAPESSSLSQALSDLREEMAELGAQIIQKGSQAQTAEAARIDAAAESSVLSNLVGNASEGIEQALEWAAGFMGGDPEKIEYKLNTEFFDDTLDPQARIALMAEWQNGIIAKSDYRRALRRADHLAADRTDEEIDGELQSEPPRLTGEALDLSDGT